jgi:hypothetical protein
MTSTKQGTGPVDRERVARVRASIDDLARAEGTAPSIRHVCLACCAALAGGGVSVSLLGELGVGSLLFATDPRSEELAELQVTVGEGAGLDALGQDRPVLVPDLLEAGAQRRWPLFAPAAHDLGVGALFAFPLQVGVIAIGVLEINWVAPGRLSPEQTASALLYADAALLVLLRLDLAAESAGAEGGADGMAGPVGPGQPSRPLGGFVDRWDEVHQATGMVSVQLGTSITEAFIRLRAHAYASDRRLSSIAGDVVARRLRFDPEPGPGSVPATE